MIPASGVGLIALIAILAGLSIGIGIGVVHQGARAVRFALQRLRPLVRHRVARLLEPGPGRHRAAPVRVHRMQRLEPELVGGGV